MTAKKLTPKEIPQDITDMLMGKQQESLFSRLKSLLMEHLGHFNEIQWYLNKKTIDTDDDIVKLVEKLIDRWEQEDY